MEKRLKRASWLIQSGCLLFFVYGILASIFAEQISLYQFQAFAGSKSAGIDGKAGEFVQILIVIIGLLGAGLALASGALFRVGISRRLGVEFICGLIAGAVGVVSLLTIHLQGRSWLLFIADNICFTPINIGLMVGGRELFKIFKEDSG